MSQSEEVRNKNKLRNPKSQYGLNCEGVEIKQNLVYTGPSSAITQKNQGAVFTLGPDCPTHIGSGYGGAGSTYCPTFNFECLPDINSEEPKYVNSSFKSPARFYISGRTNCDENLGIVDGSAGSDSKGKSSVAAVADNVRFKARESVKIVTCSPGDEKNTLGGDKRSTCGIDLIVGNRDGVGPRSNNYLQPTVLGENLVQLLTDLIEVNKQLSKRVQYLSKIHRTMAAKNSKHTHVTNAPGAPTAPSIEECATYFTNAPKLFSECESMAGKNIIKYYESLSTDTLKGEISPDWILSKVRVS